LGWQIELTGCGVGSTQVTLAANAVADLAGNLGPTVALASNVINITPDEVVNQNLNAAGQPTGATVKEVTTDKPKVNTQVYEKPKTDGPTKQELLPNKEMVEERKPVTNELKQEAEKKIVLSESEAQPMFVIAGLLALALGLSSFAAGTSIRFKRRRH
jgi:hypothetical protein